MSNEGNQQSSGPEAVAVPQVDRWFVDQSPSTTKGRGYMDLVAAAVPRVEAERIAVERQVEYPDAIIHVWQHPDDARAEALEAVAVPSACEALIAKWRADGKAEWERLKELIEAALAPSADLRAWVQHKAECELVITIHRPGLWDSRAQALLTPASFVPSEEKHCTCGLQAALDRGDSK